MAFRFSTKVRNDMMGLKATCNQLVTGTNVSFTAAGGTGGRGQILDSDDQLAGFLPGDEVTVEASLTVTNEGSYEIITAVAGIIEVAASLLTDEAAVTAGTVILGSARGGSLIDQFRNGIMVIRSASQPTHADDAETGSELVKITESSEDFVAEEAANGINFGGVSEAELHAAAGEVWSGEATATATAGHFRIYDNDFETGADTDDTKRRIDGAIATSGSQMNMANTSITSGGSTTIDDVDIPMAESV